MRGQREQILNRIRAATHAVKAPQPFPDIASNTSNIFQEPNTDLLAEQFAVNFMELGGKFVYCADGKELLTNLVKLNDEYNFGHLHCNDDLLLNFLDAGNFLTIKSGPYFNDLDAAITDCSALVARTGSLLITSDSPSGRVLNVYCPVHICIAFSNQVVWDIKDALCKFGSNTTNLPSMINLATGPSRTADIEKTLVVGVHGPKEVFLFYVDQPSPISS
jgi:L-lactate dehydrogenase complex protein LldG